MKKSQFLKVAFAICVLSGMLLLTASCAKQPRKEEAAVKPEAEIVAITPVEVITEAMETAAEPEVAEAAPEGEIVVAEEPAPEEEAEEPAVEVELAETPEEPDAAPDDDDSPLRLAARYPDFATGVLSQALLDELGQGELLRSGDVAITKDMLSERVEAIPEDQREAMLPFTFYLFEGMALETLFNQRVLGDKEPPADEEGWRELSMAYFEKVVGDVKASEADAADFYKENKEMFGDTPLDAVKEELLAFLSQERQVAAIEEHIRNLGRDVPILIHAPWVAEQAERVKDNPVDKALAAGKPVLVDFWAQWCGPCMRMKPTVEALKEEFADQLTVLLINVDEQQFLANRHSVASIPLLLFYDAEGKLVSRQEGYLDEEELRKELAKIGVS